MKTKLDFTIRRRDCDPPFVIAHKGWRFHHLGIPTNYPRPGEKYLKKYKMYVSGFNTNPFGIEWMRFEPECEISEIIQTVPHLAFEVDNLESALKDLGKTAEVSSPSEGVRVAMIVHDGAPVELIEFSNKT
jgi:hypothetical protein